MWPVVILGVVVVGGIVLLARYGVLGGGVALGSNPGIPGWLMVPKGITKTDALKRIHTIHWRGQIQGYNRLLVAILPWVKRRGFKGLVPRYCDFIQCTPGKGEQPLSSIPTSFQPYLAAGWTLKDPMDSSSPLKGGAVGKVGDFNTEGRQPNAISGEDIGLWLWPPSVWGDGDPAAARDHVVAWLAHWEAVMKGRWVPSLTVRKQWMAGVDTGVEESYYSEDEAQYFMIVPPNHASGIGTKGYQSRYYKPTAENVFAAYVRSCCYYASIGLIKGPPNLPAGPHNDHYAGITAAWVKSVTAQEPAEVTPGRPDAKVSALAKGFAVVLGLTKAGKQITAAGGAGAIQGAGAGVWAQLINNVVSVFEKASRGRIGKAAWHDDWTPVWVHHSVFGAAVETFYDDYVSGQELGDRTKLVPMVVDEKAVAGYVASLAVKDISVKVGTTAAPAGTPIGAAKVGS